MIICQLFQNDFVYFFVSRKVEHRVFSTRYQDHESTEWAQRQMEIFIFIQFSCFSLPLSEKPSVSEQNRSGSPHATDIVLAHILTIRTRSGVSVSGTACSRWTSVQICNIFAQKLRADRRAIGSQPRRAIVAAPKSYCRSSKELSDVFLHKSYKWHKIK